MCREVTIKPNTKWGGDGSLGCGIGYGYLHRIPVRELPPETKPLFRMPISVAQNQSGQPSMMTMPTTRQWLQRRCLPFPLQRLNRQWRMCRRSSTPSRPSVREAMWLAVTRPYPPARRESLAFRRCRLLRFSIQHRFHNNNNNSRRRQTFSRNLHPRCHLRFGHCPLQWRKFQLQLRRWLHQRQHRRLWRPPSHLPQ